MALPAMRPRPRDWLVPIVAPGRDGPSVMLSCAAPGIVMAANDSTDLGIRLDHEITALGAESPRRNAPTALRLAAAAVVLPRAWNHHPEVMTGTEGTGRVVPTLGWPVRAGLVASGALFLAFCAIDCRRTHDAEAA